MPGKARIVDYLNPGNLTNPAWRKRHKPIQKIVIVLVAYLALVAMLQSAGLIPQSSATQAAQSRGDRWSTLNDREKTFWAREAVKGQLRDPGSAEFRGLRLADQNTVCGEVNAKNGFGGYSGWQSFVVGTRGQTVMLDQPCP